MISPDYPLYWLRSCIAAAPSPPQISTPDPEEVDISNHPYTTREKRIPSPSNPRTDEPTQDDIRQLLRSGAPDARQANQAPLPFGLADFSNQDSNAPSGEDPMMALLQQMMGGVSPGGQGGLDASGLPAGFASLLGNQGPPKPTTPPPLTSYIWRIVHAIFALSLGVYILATEPFSGSRLGRTPVVSLGDKQPNMCWIFATVELGLQSARFMLDRGREEPGMLGTISAFLPPVWKARVRLVGTYSGIWTTLVADAMVVIWVLGVGAWWKGAAV